MTTFEQIQKEFKGISGTINLWTDGIQYNFKATMKEEPKQETLEEAAEQYTKDATIFLQGVEEGIREQLERSYSEEDMRKCWDASKRFERPISEGYAPNFNEFIEQFKKK